jgi:RNA polymerase sigma-70 factor (ECF subfamily)
MAIDRGPDPLHGLADEVLVRLVLADGSEAAFRALHRRHAPRLLRIAIRMLGAESDAEDAIQDMWMRAVPRLGTFEWRSALATWLTAILVNICREMLARGGRWATVDLDDDLLATDGAAAGEPIDLERAIAMLPPACRSAFVLHDIEGFTHDEIAGQLGWAAGTSKTQVFRARRTLRRLLGGAEVEETRHGS